MHLIKQRISLSTAFLDFSKEFIYNYQHYQYKEVPHDHNRFGERYKPHVITQWWSRHRQPDFGLDCSLHDLRRTYATMLSRNNVSIKTTMDLLGDSSTDVVLGVYQQVANDEEFSNGCEYPGDPNCDDYGEIANCRCTMVAAVDGVDQSKAARWSRLPDGMTYDEWKVAAARRKKKKTQS